MENAKSYREGSNSIHSIKCNFQIILFRNYVCNHQIYLVANSEPLLQVKQDKKGAYVDKIRHVQIESKEDAYRVLEAGRKNLSVGQTRLNKGDNLFFLLRNIFGEGFCTRKIRIKIVTPA